MKNICMNKFQGLIQIILILFTTGVLISAQGLPSAKPEEVGLSSERLDRIESKMNAYVGTGNIPGMITVVARHGKVTYFKASGMMDVDTKKPMSKDAIFRIASMSKPITSVAIMILFEEGHFLLTDPVSKFIPEFSNPQVIVKSTSSDGSVLIPAKSEITIRHLLNHTSGITDGTGLQEKYYKEAGIIGGEASSKGTIGDMVKKLGPLPLICHPGEEFHYSLSTDVLGYLVEVISKMPLDEFLKKRIYEPLGMTDTYFSLPAAKFPRLAGMYKVNPDGKLVKSPKNMNSPVVQTYFSGGGGIMTTASDYVRFAQMLLNKGELDGKRILSRKTIELMTTNSIGDKFIRESFRPGQGDKFGYGFGIRTERGVYDELESIGSFGWDGAYYTRFWVDPKEELIGIFLTQMDTFWSANYLSIFKVMVYQSIAD